ncbi:MAG: putative nucleotidyltransferase substrate binding domain-containing protein [Rhodospirillales bacterium]
MEPRTAIFRMLVRESMAALPPTAAPETPLRQIVQAMVEANASSLVITDETARPKGIITEHDIARRAIFKTDGNTPAAEIMTRPVQVIDESEYLYHAIALMRRTDLRHMPAVDGSGRLSGMLNLHDTLGTASSSLMDQIDSLTQGSDIAGLSRIKAAQIGLADQLFRDNLPATEIQALLSHINLDIYRRVTDGAIRAMAAEGLGPPPVEFSVIVMGSGGRGESFLFPDQDNGFILEDYPDADHARIDGWFINLAERMTQDLDAVGLPLCRGFVMATNPLWRKTISQWKEQIRLWSRKRGSAMLRLCDIFFDFRSAWGREDLADDLRRHVTATARGNHLFLQEMFEDDQAHGPALGWFRRFITMKDSDAPGYKGYLNLKHSGTLPLVEAMRLLCLREGLVVNPTLDRLQALHEKGILSDDEADYLQGAYRHISHLLLRQQIADYQAGRPVTNFVHPGSLTRRETDILKDGFEAIRRLQDRMRGEFTGDVLQ